MQAQLSAATARRGEPLPLEPALLCRVARWIEAIPFAAWPQQHRLADGLIRPAMVGDLEWHQFGEVTVELIRASTPRPFGHAQVRNRLLSVVMPGATIPPHTDELGSDWLTRVHVPLQTNADAMLITGDTVRRMGYGFAYEIDTRARHAVWNAGTEPRIHLMFDLHEYAPPPGSTP